MAGSPRRFDTFFRSSTLSVAAAGVAEQALLLQQIRESLPKSLANHCLHCLRKNDTLTIQVGTAAQATLLRFQTSGLPEKIARQGGPLFREIRIRTLPAAADVRGPKSRQALRPSAETTRMLIAAAEVNEEGEIRSALMRLGQTLEKAGTR